MDQEGIRLNKYLAHNTGVSRREADGIIGRGRVTVNGEVAQLGARVRPDTKVALDGKTVVAQDRYYYVALHKPTGYVCSRRAQGDAPTIYTLLPDRFHSLKPVGRLDKDSSGILLLTDDGDLAFRMTHPSFYKQKTYLVSLNTDLAPLHQQMISDFQIKLDDGPSRMSLERMSDDNRTDWRVVMSEGRNRQIRRTFASLGYAVSRLHRTDFGNYALGDMKSGEHKEVNIR